MARNLTVKGFKQTQVFNDVIRARKYVGAVNTGTTSVINAQEIKVFNLGEGYQDANISTGEIVTLLKCDTSLQNANGIVPNGNYFTCYGIAIDVHIGSQSPTTPFSGNTVTAGGGTISVVPLAVANPYPAVDVIRSQVSFELYRNNTQILESGNVADYPCGLMPYTQGSNGQATVPAAAGFTPGAAYTINGFIMAANGQTFRPLTVAQVFKPNDQFFGKLIFNRPITLTATGLVFYIDVLLIGEFAADYDNDQNLSDDMFVQKYGGGG